MPTPTYVDGATGMRRGVTSAETGLKIESISWDIADPKEYSMDENGSKDGFVHNFDPSVTISVSAEISSTTVGVPIAQFGTAITFANETGALLADSGTTFANIANSGGFYPESVNFEQSREGFFSMNITAISHPEIT